MQLAVIDPVTHRWTGEWGPTITPNTTPTLAQLRATSRYHVVSDAQLKRDLKGRTLNDVYRENRAKRGVEPRYVPKHMMTRWCRDKSEYLPTVFGGHDSHIWRERPTIEAEYLAWCEARNHTPHPASIDSDHPMHAGQREKCPKREIVS